MSVARVIEPDAAKLLLLAVKAGGGQIFIPDREFTEYMPGEMELVVERAMERAGLVLVARPKTKTPASSSAIEAILRVALSNNKARSERGEIEPL